MIHAPPMPRRLQLEHQNHSGSRIQRQPTCLTQLRNKSFASKVENVSEIQPLFVVRNMLRHDPRSSHARQVQLEHQNHSGSRTDVFDSHAQQVSCLFISEDF
ncbi:uncharacterized protein G2W53_033633 [Senna tora]|uniref:Uncharacterized protein n=1 Tax=Senna tora TaxID=362788 RepID=A0A834T2J7_9FABA|nr:uncharacterized protein G2W53_033633 [Senna tora]